MMKKHNIKGEGAGALRKKSPAYDHTMPKMENNKWQAINKDAVKKM